MQEKLSFHTAVLFNGFGHSASLSLSESFCSQREIPGDLKKHVHSGLQYLI